MSNNTNNNNNNANNNDNLMDTILCSNKRTAEHPYGTRRTVETGGKDNNNNNNNNNNNTSTSTNDEGLVIWEKQRLLWRNLPRTKRLITNLDDHSNHALGLDLVDDSVEERQNLRQQQQQLNSDTTTAKKIKSTIFEMMVTKRKRKKLKGRIDKNATYSDILLIPFVKFKNGPIKLEEMVDFLVKTWREETDFW
jgi:hypothetical protein